MLYVSSVQSACFLTYDSVDASDSQNDKDTQVQVPAKELTHKYRTRVDLTLEKKSHICLGDQKLCE